MKSFSNMKVTIKLKDGSREAHGDKGFLPI